MNSNYILVKKSDKNETVYINFSSAKGYEFKPKNLVKYPGVKVNSLILIKPSFVEKILKKKIKRKLNLYLQYFIDAIDENADDDTNLLIVLDDLEKFKRILSNKYKAYLDEKYMKLLNRKIALLENEMKNKIVQIRNTKEMTSSRKR